MLLDDLLGDLFPEIVFPQPVAIESTTPTPVNTPEFTIGATVLNLASHNHTSHHKNMDGGKNPLVC